VFGRVKFNVEGDGLDAVIIGAAAGAAPGFGCDRDAAAERLASRRPGFAWGFWDGLTMTGGKL
jgi:hypothetical protein